MCLVSIIGDEWRKTSVPDWYPSPTTIITDGTSGATPVRSPTQQEFDELKRDVEALRELLKAAKIYDEVTGQKDCEVDEKVTLIKQLAEYLDVDMEDVFE